MLFNYNFSEFYEKLFFSVTPDIYLDSFDIKIFYTRYVTIFIYFSFIFLILCFLYFIKNDKPGKKLVFFFKLSCLMILTEIFIYISPFVMLKKILYIISVFVYILLLWEFCRLALEKFIKKEKIFKILNFLFITAAFIFSFSGFSFLFFNNSLYIAEKINIFYFKYFFVFYLAVQILFILVIIFKKGKKLNKEAKYYISFYFILLMMFPVFKTVFFYINCNLILVLGIFLMFMNYKIGDFRTETENIELKKIYVNVFRRAFLLLIILAGTYIINLNWQITMLLLVISIVELSFFSMSLFDYITEFNFLNIILKLKSAENLEIYKEIFEVEVKREFNLKKCKMTVIKRGDKELKKKISSYSFLTKNIIMYGKTYSLGIKMDYMGKTIGYLLVDDPRILFYKRKLEDLKRFLRDSNYILDYLIIREVKQEYEEEIKETLEKRVEELENRIFYYKEYTKLLKNKETLEEIRVIAEKILSENKEGR